MKRQLDRTKPVGDGEDYSARSNRMHLGKEEEVISERPMRKKNKRKIEKEGRKKVRNIGENIDNFIKS